MTSPKPRTSSQHRASRFNYLRRAVHGLEAHCRAVLGDYNSLSPQAARIEKAYAALLQAVDAAHHDLIAKDWNSR
jgi:hypothetical protein